MKGGFAPGGLRGPVVLPLSTPNPRARVLPGKESSVVSESREEGERGGLLLRSFSWQTLQPLPASGRGWQRGGGSPGEPSLHWRGGFGGRAPQSGLSHRRSPHPLSVLELGAAVPTVQCFLSGSSQWACQYWFACVTLGEELAPSRHRGS